MTTMPEIDLKPTIDQLISRYEHLLKIIESKKQEEVYLNGWISNCGTVACIGGWACLDPYFQSEGLHLLNNTIEEAIPVRGDSQDFRSFLNYFGGPSYSGVFEGIPISPRKHREVAIQRLNMVLADLREKKQQVALSFASLVTGFMILFATIPTAQAQQGNAIRSIQQNGPNSYTIIWQQPGDWTQVTRQGGTITTYSNGGSENPGTYQPVPILPDLLNVPNQEPNE